MAGRTDASLRQANRELVEGIARQRLLRRASPPLEYAKQVRKIIAPHWPSVAFEHEPSGQVSQSPQVLRAPDENDPMRLRLALLGFLWSHVPIVPVQPHEAGIACQGIGNTF